MRLCVARVGGSMPDHPWHRASTCSIGQLLGRRARDPASRNPERPESPDAPGSGGRARAARCTAARRAARRGLVRDRRRRTREGSACTRDGTRADGCAPLRGTHGAPEATRDVVTEATHAHVAWRTRVGVAACKQSHAGLQTSAVFSSHSAQTRDPANPHSLPMSPHSLQTACKQ